MAVQSKFVGAGDWRTLESFWNVTTTAFFVHPAGAEVKIRYSGSWFGVDRQRQTLDGLNPRRLAVGKWSALTARVQILTSQDATVTYVVEPGDVAVMPPSVSF